MSSVPICKLVPDSVDSSCTSVPGAIVSDIGRQNSFPERLRHGFGVLPHVPVGKRQFAEPVAEPTADFALQVRADSVRRFVPDEAVSQRAQGKSFAPTQIDVVDVPQPQAQFCRKILNAKKVETVLCYDPGRGSKFT